ncbi:Hypothetical predicted protein [Octopus vulgaris]|uniref:Uncharacterized protein n=1 Tax=Octopus vulgaris TaxID=6645 RepID=A0AA36AT21_OCTVU|nr:Hypothetical predicted protein [Octopus vulgaris]
MTITGGFLSKGLFVIVSQLCDIHSIAIYFNRILYSNVGYLLHIETFAEIVQHNRLRSAAFGKRIQFVNPLLKLIRISNSLHHTFSCGYCPVQKNIMDKHIDNVKSNDAIILRISDFKFVHCSRH